MYYKVSQRLNIDVAVAEEHILDTPEQIFIFSNWMEKESTARCLLFMYQDLEHLPLEECGRHMSGQKGQMVMTAKLFACSRLVSAKWWGTASLFQQFPSLVAS